MKTLIIIGILLLFGVVVGLYFSFKSIDFDNPLPDLDNDDTYSQLYK